jgi:hypothetical protein
MILFYKQFLKFQNQYKTKNSMRKKTLSIVILLVISFSPKSIKAQTSLQDSLVNINLANYIGKPIDSILTKLPSSYDTLKIGPALTVTQGAKILISYNQLSYTVTLVPITSNFITKLNRYNLPFNQAWPLNLLKQENFGVCRNNGF